MARLMQELPGRVEVRQWNGVRIIEVGGAQTNNGSLLADVYLGDEARRLAQAGDEISCGRLPIMDGNVEGSIAVGDYGDPAARTRRDRLNAPVDKLASDAPCDRHRIRASPFHNLQVLLLADDLAGRASAQDPGVLLDATFLSKDMQPLGGFGRATEHLNTLADPISGRVHVLPPSPAGPVARLKYPCHDDVGLGQGVAKQGDPVRTEQRGERALPQLPRERIAAGAGLARQVSPSGSLMPAGASIRSSGGAHWARGWRWGAGRA